MEQIIFDDVLYAIIIPDNYHADGIEFVSKPEYPQQLAYMHHPAGKIILPHRHNPVPREIVYIQEVLLIKKGRLRVDFYDKSDKCLGSHVLNSGDVIFLVDGGHGFEALDDLEMIEVKQGPYAGENDKTRFEPNTKTN